MQLGLPRIRGEMSWPSHIQKWHLSDGTSPRNALRRRALLALVPLLMQSALFHVEWSASQLARRLAPVHAGAGAGAGRGQESSGGRLHARGRNLIPATKFPLFQTRNKTTRGGRDVGERR